jgi:hypothetical protein
MLRDKREVLTSSLATAIACGRRSSSISSVTLIDLRSR